MSDKLAIYLHDHLAGSHFAVKLLKAVEEQYAGEPLAAFAQALRADVEQDQGTLQMIIDQVGKSSVDLTEAAGWLMERASQFKLARDDSDGGIGTFEALETLSLGIQGKLGLWRVLPVVRGVDGRIPAEDFGMLAGRAEEQFARVEQRRLEMAPVTFVHKPQSAR